MKRIFIMLLITCSAIVTYAQQNDKSLAQPTHVIELLNGIISDFGQTSDQIYSVQKNPNTNQLESSIRIVKFLAEIKEWFGEDIGDCFIKDEPVSYQMQHFSPGNKEMFGINVKNISIVTGFLIIRYNIKRGRSFTTVFFPIELSYFTYRNTSKRTVVHSRRCKWNTSVRKITKSLRNYLFFKPLIGLSHYLIKF